MPSGLLAGLKSNRLDRAEVRLRGFVSQSRYSQRLAADFVERLGHLFAHGTRSPPVFIAQAYHQPNLTSISIAAP
jgi:hypothetical protein